MINGFNHGVNHYHFPGIFGARHFIEWYFLFCQLPCYTLGGRLPKKEKRKFLSGVIYSGFLVPFYSGVKNQWKGYSSSRSVLIHLDNMLYHHPGVQSAKCVLFHGIYFLINTPMNGFVH